MDVGRAIICRFYKDKHVNFRVLFFLKPYKLNCQIDVQKNNLIQSLFLQANHLKHQSIKYHLYRIVPEIELLFQDYRNLINKLLQLDNNSLFEYLFLSEFG